MSDIMYNDEPNWKELIKSYLIHDDRQIKGFFEDYRWLSNFYPAPVWYQGNYYLNSEAAYQAAKIQPDYREDFTQMSAVDAKKKWGLLKYPKYFKAKEWDEVKYQVMSSIIFDKFLNNLDLRQKLLDTGDRYLEETNHWKDTYWGVDIKLGGENNLGNILMKARTYFNS